MSKELRSCTLTGKFNFILRGFRLMGENYVRCLYEIRQHLRIGKLNKFVEIDSLQSLLLFIAVHKTDLLVSFPCSAEVKFK